LQDRVPVGYVRRAHGIAGAVIVRPVTDDPASRFAVGETLHTDGDPPRALEIEEVGAHKDGLLVRFVGVTDRSVSEALRGVQLTIASSQRRELDRDEFWPEDLVGCVVEDTNANTLGTVAEVVFGTAQHRIAVVTPHGDRVEVPFVAALVPKVDIDAGRVVIDPPTGLFGGEEAR
jgi:16S rRNA processing protein RimM